jgi:hypothetical protein
VGRRGHCASSALVWFSVVLSTIALIPIAPAIQNLIAVHTEAVDLTRGGPPAFRERSGAAQGLSDPLMLIVGVFTLVALAVTVYCLSRGRQRFGVSAYTCAALGSCVLWIDALLVRSSGWLAVCGQCGGPIEAAQGQANTALALMSVTFVCAAGGRIWLSAWLRLQYYVR